MSHIIEMNDVTWSRNGQQVLRGVDWRVKEGEHWALLGLNGSGKTTLLNMLCGYIWPTSGEIRVLGHKYGEVDLREHRKLIGWVSSSLQTRVHGQDKAQHLVLSGKYASFGLYDKPEDHDYDVAHDLMRQLGCGHLIDRTYQTCSQGEQQKLLIARALMSSPKLLILDEATNGLDFISRESLLDSIRGLCSQKNAPHMLYVTHHIEEILPQFTHTLLLRKGQVFQSGLTREMLQSELLSDFLRHRSN